MFQPAMRPDRHVDDWIAYIAAALLVLAYKWAKYVREGKKRGLTTKQASQEWFFDASPDNVCSWAITFGWVWCAGTLFIYRIDIGLGDWVQKLPVLTPFCFLFGAINEMYAPALARWVLNKLPLVTSTTPEQR